MTDHLTNYEKVDRCLSSSNGHSVQEAEEVQIPVPWGHVAGKWWGPKNEQPIICLHGWQDNCGTFDRLALELSTKTAMLAIDLPGHGHSSHLPDGQFYYVFWDGLVLLRRVVKHYKWDKLTINRRNNQRILEVIKDRSSIGLVGSSASRKKKPRNFVEKRTRKWWGPKEVQPVIVLHGRQDNASSFDALMPSLSKQISFLCLDLPGHGFSSHLSMGSYYYVYWDGIQLIRRIVKYFKWTKVKILGHSLGGAIGFLYAASYPNEVDTLISLDIASPSVREITKTVASTGDQIDRFLKYEHLTLDNVPCYDYEEMIDIVEDGYAGSITRESAEILMRRGMQPAPTPGRHYFSRDPRLKTSMLGMLSMDLVLAYASKIKCAYLNIRAVPGLKFDHPEHYQMVLDKIHESSRRFEYREVTGTHHVHLNEPGKVAPIIKEFLSV